MREPTNVREDDELPTEDVDRFSQEDDDRAGRSWHGMNSSDFEVEDVGRLQSDEDDESADEESSLDGLLQPDRSRGS